jgi:hypothetical protein
MTKDSPRPTGADTMLWWSGLATQWKKNMATEWGEIQARLMEEFNDNYKDDRGLH